MNTPKRLTRSKTDKMLGGVCGGLGEYFGIDPTIVRLVFVGLFFLGVGFPIIGYLLLWIIVPPADRIAGQLTATEPESGETAASVAEANVAEATQSTQALSENGGSPETEKAVAKNS